VFDNTGNVTGSRAYSAFGSVIAVGGVGMDRYGFTGTSMDSLTGYIGDNDRLLNPDTGKWTSDDPIGFAGGDPNLSRYVANGPTTGRDPSGLKDWRVAFHEVMMGRSANFNPETVIDGVKDFVHGKVDEAARVFNFDARPAHVMAEQQIDRNKTAITMTAGVGLVSAEFLHDQFLKEDTNPNSWGVPGFWEGLIPVWGSGRTSANAFQNGRYGSGILNAALAISDLTLIPGLVKGGVKAIGVGVVREATLTTVEGTAKTGGREVLEQVSRTGCKEVSGSATESATAAVGKGECGQFGAAVAKENSDALGGVGRGGIPDGVKASKAPPPKIDPNLPTTPDKQGKIVDGYYDPDTGEIFLRRGLSPTEAAKVYRHETVHWWLDPKGKGWVTQIRKWMNDRAYWNSALFQGLEEFLAEAYATGSVRSGWHHAFSGAYTTPLYPVLTATAAFEALVFSGGLALSTYGSYRLSDCIFNSKK
jgi:RHS repeat-associated protein